MTSPPRGGVIRQVTRLRPGFHWYCEAEDRTTPRRRPICDTLHRELGKTCRWIEHEDGEPEARSGTVELRGGG